MKAIIEVARKGSVFKSAAAQLAGVRLGRPQDFRLSFESAKSLFAELTPARLADLGAGSHFPQDRYNLRLAELRFLHVELLSVGNSTSDWIKLTRRLQLSL